MPNPPLCSDFPWRDVPICSVDGHYDESGREAGKSVGDGRAPVIAVAPHRQAGLTESLVESLCRFLADPASHPYLSDRAGTLRHPGKGQHLFWGDGRSGEPERFAISEFVGEHGFLSPSWPVNIEIEDVAFRNAACAIESFRLPPGERRNRQLHELSLLPDAESLRSPIKEARGDWDSVKADAMRKVIELTFERPELAGKLLAKSERPFFGIHDDFETKPIELSSIQGSRCMSGEFPAFRKREDAKRSREQEA